MSKTVLEMARETGYIVYDGHSGVDITFDENGIKRFAALICEAEGKRLDWACEQARDPCELSEFLRGFDHCSAVLNAERIET